MKSGGKLSFPGKERIKSAISPTGCAEGLEPVPKEMFMVLAKMELKLFNDYYC